MKPKMFKDTVVVGYEDGTKGYARLSSIEKQAKIRRDKILADATHVTNIVLAQRSFLIRKVLSKALKALPWPLTKRIGRERYRLIADGIYQGEKSLRIVNEQGTPYKRVITREGTITYRRARRGTNAT